MVGELLTRRKVSKAAITFVYITSFCSGFSNQFKAVTKSRWQQPRRLLNDPSFQSARVLFSVAPSTSDTIELNSSTYLGRCNTTVTFPPYSTLMNLEYGEYVLSDEIEVLAPATGQAYKFRVKLYPRGGGHIFQKNVFNKKDGDGGDKNNIQQQQYQKSGFGMSYAILPMFGRPPPESDQKVGAYLQFLPSNDANEADNVVDATFTLRLLGAQASGPKFDVAWTAGMRFVDLKDTKLKSGRANDFGAHLMQTPMLSSFLGVDEDGALARDTFNSNGNIDDDDDQPAVKMNVEIILHDPPNVSDDRVLSSMSSDSITTPEEIEESSLVPNKGNRGLFSRLLPVNDIRSTASGSPNQQHDPEEVRVGRVVVPILNRLSERNRMFQQGAYPGVEYRILRVIDPATDQDIFYSKPGVDYELKPIYPLVPQLERPWPVRVNEKDLPTLYTPSMYNTISAVGSLFTAVFGLLTAFILSQAVSLFFIPSRSMDPTLQVGDVLLVDKLTPRLFRDNYKTGEVVLFSPPQELREIVASTGGKLTDRDLFVKRIAAEPGDRLSVDKTGAVRIQPKETNDPSSSSSASASTLPRRDLCTAEPLRLIERYITPVENKLVEPGQVVVFGDCASVSVDSRVWGALPRENIRGKPLVRIWPLARFGRIPSLPTATADWTD